jgi:hypothetical protein
MSTLKLLTFLISNMFQPDGGRLLLPQGEGWDEGIKKQKALLIPSP